MKTFLEQEALVCECPDMAATGGIWLLFQSLLLVPMGGLQEVHILHCGNIVVVAPPNIGGVDERKNGEPVCISQNLVLKMLEEHKAVILQKYARAWLARRRFQSIRRFVLNIQLTYRVQRLQKKLEDQVGVPNASFILIFSNRCILSWPVP